MEMYVHKKHDVELGPSYGSDPDVWHDFLLSNDVSVFVMSADDCEDWELDADELLSLEERIAACDSDVDYGGTDGGPQVSHDEALAFVKHIRATAPSDAPYIYVSWF